MKTIAQEFIDNELSVTPVLDKRPLIDGWQNISGEDILGPRYDFAWNKSNGLGLLLGETSGVICLDIDILSNNEGLAEIRAELLAMLPPIFSGRNGHPDKPTARFFKYSGEINEKFNHIAVELLSTGNQVVLPPSKHPSGVTYSWVGEHLQDIDIDELPDLPEEILVWLRERNNERKKDKTETTFQPMPGRCQSGSHNYLSSIGVAMRHSGARSGEVIARLLREDKRINGNHDSLYFLCKTRKWKASTVEENALAFVSVIFKNHKVDSIHEKYKTLKDGFFFITPATEKTKAVKTPDFYGMANYMKNELHLKCKEREQYIFNGKFYEEIDKLGIENKAYELTKYKCGPNHLGNFSKVSRVLTHYNGDFINPNDKLNMNNGILFTESMQLTKHNKKTFFTYRLTHDFSESMETPVFDKFLNLVATNDQTKALLIQEYIGYILSGCNYERFNKILILDGGGANGKTSLINLVQHLVGVENTSSESLVALGENRFAANSLVGKLVNFCAEEPKQAFAASGVLKKLTGNDQVMIEPKHKPSFQYINYAKFIISYNKMPFLPDTTSGMERRLMIIPCVTDLEKNPEIKIKDLQKSLAPEYGAIINKCLIAFKMVQARGDFTVVEAGKARYKELVLQSDPFLNFMHLHVAVFAEMSEADQRELKKSPLFEPTLTGGDLWLAFQKFMGPSSKYKEHGFKTRVGAYLKGKSGVEKVEKPRGWDGIVLVYDD